MKRKKSPILVVCALLAVLCGCGTEQPIASQDAADVVAKPDTNQEPADTVAERPEDFTNSIGMKFKLIPAGEFMMGSPEDEEGREPGESPVHQVHITKPYYLGVTEVTQGQWEDVMKTRPYEDAAFTRSGLEYAVSHVSWDDAVEFCQQLSAKEGREYGLPTEAQWEYACRAGSETRYCFGDDDSDLGSYAWYDKNAFHKDEWYAHEVGLKQPNAWGLHDMHGNAGEWCQDWSDMYSFDTSPVDNPTGPSTGFSRVCRGGGWDAGAGFCRAAYRQSWFPDLRSHTVGFRVPLDPR